MSKFEFKNTENKTVGSLELQKNKLFIYGDILMDRCFQDDESDDICPKDIVEFLKNLELQEEIEIHINSGGGSVFGGLAIYNLLKTYKARKIVYIDGLAGSISSVIALCGDKVYAYKNSMMMIHNPLVGICGYYNAKELETQIDALENCKKAILNIYVLKTNTLKTIEQEKLQELMDNETWLVGDEIAEYFNVNILENKNEMVACTSDYFSKYKNIPKNIVKNNHLDSDLELEKKKILEELEKISLF